MKKIFTIIITLILSLVAALSFTACGDSGISIAVPNDTTNEARALLLLEANGYIKLKEGAGISATVRDIEENPLNIKFKEVEAASLPSILKDVDYAVINSNYAIDAGLNPVSDSLLIEGSYSKYGNILAVKSGNENTDKIKALKAALQSQTVKDYIAQEYAGAVVSTVDNPTDGFDQTVDYSALSGVIIKVAASPAPHAEILQIAKNILAQRNVVLQIVEFNDYIQPNTVVNDGEVDANYFQHLPYLEDFNLNKGTNIVSVATIHVEPMGLYGGKQSNLNLLSK